MARMARSMVGQYAAEKQALQRTPELRHGRLQFEPGPLRGEALSAVRVLAGYHGKGWRVRLFAGALGSWRGGMRGRGGGGRKYFCGGTVALSAGWVLQALGMSFCLLSVLSCCYLIGGGGTFGWFGVEGN